MHSQLFTEGGDGVPVALSFLCFGVYMGRVAFGAWVACFYYFGLALIYVLFGAARKRKTK